MRALGIRSCSLLVVIALLSSMLVPSSASWTDDRLAMSPAIADQLLPGADPSPALEVDLDGVAGLSGAFLENRGQLTDDRIALYARGGSLSVAFARGWVGYLQHGTEGSYMYRVSFPGSQQVQPVGGGPLPLVTNYYLGNDPSSWVEGARSYERVVYEDLWEGVDLHFFITGSELKYEFHVSPGADPASIVMEYEGVTSLEVDGEGDLMASTPLGCVRDRAPIAYGADSGEEIPCWFLATGHRVAFVVQAHGPSEGVVIDPGFEFGTYFGEGGCDETSASDCLAVGEDGSIFFGSNGWSPDFPTTPGAFCETSSGVQDATLSKLDAGCTALRFSTFLGGWSIESINAVALGPEGNVYVVGQTFSDDFPLTQDAYRSTYKAGECFISEFNSTGALLYSTYFGGNGLDGGWDIEVDGEGGLYCALFTFSDDIPTTSGAFCSTLQGTAADLVVAKLGPPSDLMYCTYVGGTLDEGPFNIDLDSAGCAYVAGWTSSTDFPTTPGCYDPTANGGDFDTFLLKLNGTGGCLEYSTYFGGSDIDMTSGVTVDAHGCAWVYGSTKSRDLPTTDDAFQTGFEGSIWNGFFTRFSSNGSEITYSSYLGPGSTTCDDLALDEDGNPVVLLTTGVTSLPCPKDATAPRHSGGTDMYLLWFDNATKDPLNATFYGGSGVEREGRLDLAPDRTMVLVAETSSTDLRVSLRCLQPNFVGAPPPPVRFNVCIAGFTMDRTPRLPLEPPEGLRAEAGDGQVELAWDHPSSDVTWPVTGYNVYMGTEEGCETLAFSLPLTRTHLIDGLENGREYLFRVSSFNFLDESPLSDAVRETPYDLPGPPVNLVAEAGPGIVNLSWEPPLHPSDLELLGYTVWRGTSTASMEPLANVTDPLAYGDTDVVNGTTHYYKVQAFHRLAPGEFSITRLAKPYGPPGPPVGVVASASDGRITVSWEPPASNGGSAVHHYVVHRGTDPDRMGARFVVGTGTTFADTEVFNGITYHYAVSAVNGVMEGPWSSVASATPRGSPGPPVDLAAEEGDAQVRLSWLPPDSTGGSPVLGYTVLRGAPGETPRVLATVRNVTEYVDINVLNGEEYVYSVVARNGLGEGPPSLPLSAIPMAPPLAPEGLTIAQDDAAVELRWLPPPYDGGSAVRVYRVYRAGPGEELGLLGEVDASSTRLEDLNVTLGTGYRYAVSAVNQRFEGPLTDVMTFTPTGPPGAPRDLRVTAGDGVVTLTWLPPGTSGGLSISGYLVYMGAEGGEMTLARQVPPGEGCIVEGLTNGVEHRLAVAAVNARGEGPWTPVATAVPLGPPDAPTGLRARSSGPSVTLSWEGPASDGGTPVMGYILLRGTSPEDMVTVAELGDIRSYTDLTADRGVRYHYAVVAVNSVGQGVPSEAATVRLDSEELASPGPAPLWMLLTVIGALVVGMAAAASTEVGRYQMSLWALPLLARLNKEGVLDNRNRYYILGIIIDNPGIHYNAIIQEFDVPMGVATHHLSVLEKEHYIRSVRDGRLKRFYSAHTRVPEGAGSTPEELREAIVGLVGKRPGLSQLQVMEELGLDRDSASYYLRELVKEGRLEDGREGRYTVYRVR